MEGFSAEQQDFSREHDRSQEIINLEYRAMNRYFELAGIPKEMRKDWVEANGAALRELAEHDPRSLRAFADNPRATKEEFEEKLQRYNS
jgi:hypothetical protein